MIYGASKLALARVITHICLSECDSIVSYMVSDRELGTFITANEPRKKGSKGRGEAEKNKG